MRRAPLLVLIVCSPAHADDRSTAFSIGVMAGGLQRSQYPSSEPAGTFGPRVTLSFEHGFPPMPPQPGYNVDVTLVPELFGGGFVEPDRVELFVGVGVRGDLRFAQREMGLLRVSARGAGYLAARALVVGEDRKPFGEIGLGEYFLLRRHGRIGFEGSFLFASSDPAGTDFGTGANAGLIVQLYGGWN